MSAIAPLLDPESQRRLDRLLVRARAHAIAACQLKRRTEIRVLLIVEHSGKISAESRVDPPAEFEP